MKNLTHLLIAYTILTRSFLCFTPILFSKGSESIAV